MNFLVQHAHFTTGFLLAGAHLSAEGLAQDAHFLAHGRKFHPHLPTELHNLPLQ
jgi:hypothetical protein